jgi:hypothetical protein
MEFLDKIVKDIKSKDITSSIIECDEHTFDSIHGMMREFVDSSYIPIYPSEAAEFAAPKGRILIVYRGVSFTFIRKDY